MMHCQLGEWYMVWNKLRSLRHSLKVHTLRYLFIYFCSDISYFRHLHVLLKPGRLYTHCNLEAMTDNSLVIKEIKTLVIIEEIRNLNPCCYTST